MASEERDPVREFLESYWEANRESDRLERRIEELTCQCEHITAKYGSIPGGGGGGNSSMTTWDALIEAKNRYLAKLAESLRLEAEVEKFINSLDNRLYRAVLRYKYLEEMRWEEIGDRVHYNPDHVRRRIHGAALNAARKKWEEREAIKA